MRLTLHIPAAILLSFLKLGSTCASPLAVIHAPSLRDLAVLNGRGIQTGVTKILRFQRLKQPLVSGRAIQNADFGNAGGPPHLANSSSQDSQTSQPGSQTNAPPAQESSNHSNPSSNTKTAHSATAKSDVSGHRQDTPRFLINSRRHNQAGSRLAPPATPRNRSAIISSRKATHQNPDVDAGDEKTTPPPPPSSNFRPRLGTKDRGYNADHVNHGSNAYLWNGHKRHEEELDVGGAFLEEDIRKRHVYGEPNDIHAYRDSDVTIHGVSRA